MRNKVYGSLLSQLAELLEPNNFEIPINLGAKRNGRLCSKTKTLILAKSGNQLGPSLLPQRKRSIGFSCSIETSSSDLLISGSRHPGAAYATTGKKVSCTSWNAANWRRLGT